MAHFDPNSRPKLLGAVAEVCTNSVSNSISLANNSPEANSKLPQRAELEKLQRRRFQNPKPKIRGSWWTLLIYRDVSKDGKIQRQRQRVRLAPATMPMREVQKVAAEYIRPLNQGLEAVGSAANFLQYVDSVYKPNVLPRMAKTTSSCYEGVIKRYLEPNFGRNCLRELTPLTLERYFSGIAKTLGYAIRHKIREVLSSILGSAVKYELLVKNPCGAVKLGRKPPKRKKPVILPEQFDRLINEIAEPYATMLYVAVWTGLRVSELIGLRWNDVNAEANTITVDERCCRGDWDQPKTEDSSTSIVVFPPRHPANRSAEDGQGHSEVGWARRYEGSAPGTVVRAG